MFLLYHSPMAHIGSFKANGRTQPTTLGLDTPTARGSVDASTVTKPEAFRLGGPLWAAIFVVQIEAPAFIPGEAFKSPKLN